MKDFYLAVDNARKEGFTDSEILDYLEKSDNNLSPKIKQSREKYNQSASIKNDRDLLNFMSQKFSGQLPSTPSIANEVQQPIQQPAEQTQQPAQQLQNNIIGKGADMLSQVAGAGFNLAKGITKEITRTPYRTALMAVEGGRMLGDVLNYGTAKVRREKDPEKWLRKANTPVEYSFFDEKVRPIKGGINKETIGAGVELGLLASTPVKLGQAGLVSSKGLGGAILGGAKKVAPHTALTSTLGSLSNSAMKGENFDDTVENAITSGALGLAGGALLGGIASGYSHQKAQKALDIANKTTLGNNDVKASLATKKIVEKDVLRPTKTNPLKTVKEKIIVDDNDAKYLIDKVGINAGDVSSIKTGNRKEKQAMQEMLNIKIDGVENPELTRRPVDIIGDEIKKSIDVVAQKKREVGKQFDLYVKNNLANETIDTDNISDNFLNTLKNYDVKITDNGLDFSNSVFPNDSSIHKKIRDAYFDIKKLKTKKTAVEAQKVKQKIDSVVSYGKTTGGLEAKSESLLKQLRRDINDELSNSFDGYREINQQYSELSDALKWWQKINKSLPDELQQSSIGSRARAILSQRVSRDETIDAIIKINKVAVKYGREKTMNINKLLNFDRIMEDMIGTSAPYGFTGSVKRGAKSAIQETVGDIAGSLVKGDVIGAIGKTGGKVLSIGKDKANRDEAIKALKNIIGTSTLPPLK